MLFTACIIVLSIYGLFIFISIIGWLMPNKKINETFIHENPSLIIPFRNEEKNLAPLISSIKSQTHSAKVLFVDDNSTDSSIQVIGLTSFDIILNAGEGKKAANATGIEEARSNLLMFTDADCVIGKDHVKNYSNIFSASKFDFAYGPVINSSKNKSFLNSVFFLDQLSLNAVSLGTGRLNIHLFCSGANMAGKRKVLLNANQILKESKNLSGDDITLLNFCRESEKKITALTDKKFIVTTNSPSTLGEFFKQRLRWGQKTGINSNLLLLLLSLSVFLSSIIVIFSLIGSISEIYPYKWYFLSLGKLLIDLLFLFLVSYRLGVMRHLWFFIPAWIFNIIYIPIIGLTGLVYSGNWKGRKVRT